MNFIHKNKTKNGRRSKKTSERETSRRSQTIYYNLIIITILNVFFFRFKVLDPVIVEDRDTVLGM